MASDRTSSIIADVQVKLGNRLKNYAYQHLELKSVDSELLDSAIKVTATVVLNGEEQEVTLYNRVDVFDTLNDEDVKEVVKELVKAFDMNELFNPYRECNLVVDNATTALIKGVMANVKFDVDIKTARLCNVFKKQLKFIINGNIIFLDVCNETEMRTKAALKKTTTWPNVSFATILGCMNRREVIKLLSKII